MSKHKVLLLAALVALVVTGAVAGSARPRTGEAYGALALYSEAMSIVRDQYVDALPWTTLVDGGIKGMVRALDADSALLGPAEIRDLAGTTPPSGGDVGLVLGRAEDRLSVIAARDDTPAATVGLRSGDDILAIDGVSTQGMWPMDGAARLRGRPGTSVELSVARADWAEPRSFALTRAKSPAETVSDRSLGQGILYVRITEFREATARELEQRLEAAGRERASGLVLDLRGTAGGQVPAAVAVAGMFLDPGRVVMAVQSRVPGQPHEVRTPAAAANRQSQPMAVLVDHGTASAAEVLAGALQDWGRAAIVGTTSFGDASAQSLIPLSDDRAVRLTTARYLTPKGHVISARGIVPDIVSLAEPPPGPRRDATITGKSSSRDPEVDLAFDLVKAARILERAPAPARTAAGVTRRGSPGACRCREARMMRSVRPWEDASAG